MNVEKVIKGLEICVDLDTGCSGCPYKGYDMKNCLNRLQKDALEVIKSLVADKVRLQTEKDNLIRTYKECQSEIINDYAEKLKESKIYDSERHEYIIPVAKIDWSVQEMTGGN